MSSNVVLGRFETLRMDLKRFDNFEKINNFIRRSCLNNLIKYLCEVTD